MSSTTSPEAIHQTHELPSASYGVKDPEVPNDVSSHPMEHVNKEEVSDKMKYFNGFEKDLPGVESDFYKAISHQDEKQSKKGQAAILRMSHPYSPEAIDQTHLAWTRIKWQNPQDPPAPAQSSTAAASDSDFLGPPDGLLFEDLDDFKEALKILPRRYDPSTVPQFFEKQLIVLEDLGRDWVRALGKAFHIPPRVFALHWASPSLYKRGRAHVPLGQPAEEHFVLPYSEILPFDIKDGGFYHKLDCSPIRFVSSDMQQEQEKDRGHQGNEATNSIGEAMVSYWGRLERDREWTGTLLVDPRPELFGSYEKVRGVVRADEDGRTRGHLPIRQSRQAPLPDPRPALRSAHYKPNWSPVILKASSGDDPGSITWTPIDLGSQNAAVGSEVRQLRARELRTSEVLGDASQSFKYAMHRNIRAVPHLGSQSVFDQVLRAPPPRPNFHPVHATKFVRRLVLAKMKLVVDLYLRQTYSLTVKAMQNISKIADFEPQRLGEKPWQDEWRSEFFNRLWELRGSIELLGFDMESTIRLFSDLTDNNSWPEMQNFDTDIGERCDSDRSFRNIKIRDQDLDDLKEWENLEATRKYAAGFIERTTNSYLQAATAEGAKFANIQARTSKKITFLATLFVPASLCAAVLALPGYSGAQGTTRFWLFWVVSVPIATILAMILLYKDMRTYINDHWKKHQRKTESSNEGSHDSDMADLESRVLRNLRMRQIREAETAGV